MRFKECLHETFSLERPPRWFFFVVNIINIVIVSRGWGVVSTRPFPFINIIILDVCIKTFSHHPVSRSSAISMNISETLRETILPYPQGQLLLRRSYCYSRTVSCSQILCGQYISTRQLEHFH